MTQLYRASLAVIALTLFGADLAQGAPTITSQPRDKNGNTTTILDVHEDCAVDLRVEAVGDGPLTYVWKRGAVTLTAASVGVRELAEVDGPNLKLVPSYLTDVGDYKCEVTDSNGKTISNIIKVAAVNIRQRGVLAAAGQLTTTLKVDAAGTGLKYRWYRHTDANGTIEDRKLVAADRHTFTGEATNTLKIKAVTPDEVGKYFCRVFFNGVSLDGGHQNLAVVPTPASRSFALGETLSLQVNPVGASGFDSLSYQWKAGTTLVPGPAGTSNPLVIENAEASNAGAYTCIVSGEFRGAPVPATTTAAAQVFIVDNTPAQVLAVGGKSQIITFSPTGLPATHSYQWYKKVDAVETVLGNGAEYTGVTTSKLTVVTPDIDDAIDYFCRVTAYGDTDDAGLRSMIVIPAPASTTVAAGETAELTVLPAGASPETIANMTFQWKKGALVLDGQTGQTLSLPGASTTTAGDYVCVVTLDGVGSVTSPAGKIVIVESAPARKLALVATAAELAIVASTDTAQTYQWYKVVSGGTDQLLSNGPKYTGATTKKLKVLALTLADAGDYYCKVTSFGVVADSGLRTMVVVPNPPSRTVLSGSPLELGVVPAGAPLEDFTFQWKKGAAAIGGETSNVYLNPSAGLGDAASYSCIVTLTGVSAVTTVAAKVVVVNSAPFTRLAVTGPNTTLLVGLNGLGSTFQWFRVVDGFPDVPLANGDDYAGVTTKTLMVKTASLDDAGSYRCKVTTFGETVESSVATLVLVPPPESKVAPINSTVELQVLPVGATPAMVSGMGFQWKKASILSGETSDTLTIPNVASSHSGNYACLVSVPGAVPATITSGVAKVHVVNTIALTKMVFQGVNIAFETPVAGLGHTYQWYELVGVDEIPLVESTKHAGVTGKALTVKGATLDDAGTYFCRVSAYGQDVDGGTHRLVVVSPPPSVLVDRGDDLTLEVMSAGEPVPLTYQWRKGTAQLAGATDAVYQIDDIQTSHAGDYTCWVTLAGVTTLKTPTAKVSVVDHTEAAVLVVKGKDAKLTLGTGGAGQVFKWYRAGSPGDYLTDGAEYGGTKTKVLTVKLTDDADAGEYVCEVTAYGRMVAIGERTLEVVTSPGSTLVAVGSPLELEVTSTGTIPSLTYQWKKGTAVQAGANDATFTIGSAILTDSADFVCVVGGGGAAPITTLAAKVSVAELAPKTVAVNETKIATLTAVTKGTNISYRWYRVLGGVETPLTGGKYVGVLTNSLKISNCQIEDAGDYFCDISAYGVTLTTGAVTLDVYRAPVLPPITLPTGIVGRAYSYQIPVDPDPLRQPKTYTASPLPKGLVVNKDTGEIFGKPTVAVTNQSVTITAVNAIGTDTDTATITINALPSYLAGSYAGPLPRNAALNSDLGGALEMTVAPTGAATGKLLLGTASRSFTGSLDLTSTDSNTATATATITVARTGLTPLTMTFSIGTDGLLTDGVLTDGTASIDFHGWRNIFGSTPATEYAGRYNFAMGLPEGDPDVGDITVPQGAGFGTFTVASDGKLSFVCTAGDGTAVTSATFIGPNGEICLYKVIYTTNKGSVLAELDIDDMAPGSDDNELTGAGTWVRPANAVSTQPRVYPAGFDPVNLVIEGGRYVQPTLVLGVTAGSNNATLTFEEGGIPDARLNPNVNVSIQTGNVVTIGAPNNATLKFAATSSAATMTSTGLFKGEFTLKDDNPTTGGVNPNEISRKCTFTGIIYPKGGILVGAGHVGVDQIPTVSPPTTPTNSPILYGGAFFERKP